MPHQWVFNNMFKFTSCFCNSFSITTIDYVNKSVCIVEVMPPKRAEFLLTTYIPDCKYYVLILDFLNIKSCTRKKGEECNLRGEVTRVAEEKLRRDVKFLDDQQAKGHRGLYSSS